MVLKGAGIRGDEQTGTEELPGTVGRTVAAVGAGLIRGGFRLAQGLMEEEQRKQQAPPETQGQLRQDLYEAFVDKGVPEAIASEAADAVVLGKDTSSSPALAEAHQIVAGEQIDATREPIAESELAEDEEEDSVDDSEEAASPVSQSSAVRTSQVSVSPKVSSKEEEKAKESASVAGAEAISGDSLDKPKPVIKASKSNQQLSSESQQPANESKRKVKIEKAPSEMDWPTLRKTAREISEETGTKPEGKKKTDLLPYVENYRKQQEEENQESSSQQAEKKTQYATAVVTPTLEKAPLVHSANPSLETSYSASLEAANVDAKTAKKASKALVSGEGANTNAAIKAANKQVQQKAKPVIQSPLQQLYYDVLAKQGIDSKLATAASKDLSEGKGALSSKSVQQAHKTILDKELTGWKTPPKRNWHKHKRYVTQTDPRQRDVAIAKNATAAGMDQKKIGTMLRLNSPNVAAVQQKEGSTKAVHYIKSVVTEATSMGKQSQAAVGKSARSVAVKARPKKKEIEI